MNAQPITPPLEVAIVTHTHARKGFAMWIVTLSARVERAEFDRLLALARTARGWYSRDFEGQPAGFAFRDPGAAEAFAAECGGGRPVSAPPTAPMTGAAKAPKPVRGVCPPETANKLRAMADGLQAQIADKFRDRLTNTPKRQREAQSARLDGLRLERVQTVARALAAAYEAGTVPHALQGVTTKAALFDLARAEIKRSGGYYDAGVEAGPALTTPAAVAFWAYLKPDPEREAAEALRVKIQALQFANIPGYFPTPGAVVDLMIERAQLRPGCRVLEPSAGSGAILDKVKAWEPDCDLVIFERHYSLIEILEGKGYTLAGHDFTQCGNGGRGFTVDRVLMNPPFEAGQDMAHVRRAFDHLAPGGRLVAIMSRGPFFRQDKAAVAFREWFEAMGGEREDLPAGAFKESGTGVSTVLVVIDRD